MYLHTVVSYGPREFVTGGPYKSYGADIQIMFIIVIFTSFRLACKLQHRLQLGLRKSRVIYIYLYYICFNEILKDCSCRICYYISLMHPLDLVRQIVKALYQENSFGGAGVSSQVIFHGNCHKAGKLYVTSKLVTFFQSAKKMVDIAGENL